MKIQGDVESCCNIMQVSGGYLLELKSGQKVIVKTFGEAVDSMAHEFGLILATETIIGFTVSKGKTSAATPA